MKDNMRERKTTIVLGDLSELEDKQKHEKGALNLYFSFYFNLLHTLIAVEMFSHIALLSVKMFIDHVTVCRPLWGTLSWFLFLNMNKTGGVCVFLCEEHFSFSCLFIYVSPCVCLPARVHVCASGFLCDRQLQ